MDRARALTPCLAVFFGALCMGAPGSQQLAPAAPPVALIGVDLPLSGNDAGDGLMAQEGVLLALSDWNADLRHRRFRAIVRDTANGGFQNPHQDEGSDDPGEPLAGVISLRAFASNPALIGVVGAFRSDVAEAEAPVAHALTLPVISGSATNGTGDALFRLTGSDVQLGVASAHVARAGGYERVAVLDDGSPRAQAATRAFRRGFTLLGGVVAPDTPDATFFVGATGAAILAPPGAARTLLTPMHRALYSTRGYELPPIRAAYESIAPASARTQTQIPDVPKRFEARFMESPSDVAVAYYAATQLLLTAAASSDPPTRIHTLRAMHVHTFATLIGNVGFTAAGDNACAIFVVTTIANGRSSQSRSLTVLPAQLRDAQEARTQHLRRGDETGS